MPAKFDLSPMLVQYLVGLCCLQWDQEAVDVTIGDMVLDTAAGKERDVDVTVTVMEPGGGGTHAFKGYEVKRENSPFDVSDVEALCLKLLDMPSVTNRAVVSSSDFTSGARAKAATHGIELYVLKEWTRPLREQFPSFEWDGTPAECFPVSAVWLHWVGWRCLLDARDTKKPFTVQNDDSVLDASGKPHVKYTTFAAYRDELALRSTQILFQLDPAATLRTTYPVPFATADGHTAAGPPWPHTHTLDVRGDDVYVVTADGPRQLDQVTISGHLQYQRDSKAGRYYIMERVSDGRAFAGALVVVGAREGEMKCLIFSPKSREVGVRFVQLAEKHLNAIRRLKLDIAEARTKLETA
jgi:hypothetical protein